LSCLTDLSLRVLEKLADPFEMPADVGTLGMGCPATHLSQFDTDLSEAHLDVVQPAADGGRPSEFGPTLFGRVV
jgi:hypothetical protein